MTKTSLFVIFALVFATSPAWAEDWTTSDGKTYKSVTVVSHDATVVTISSSDGMATFPIALLEKDLQKRIQSDNATAKDWTVNGKDYHNVTVTKVDGDTVSITFDGGIGSVSMADLPKDIQKKLGYDADKIAADLKAQKDAQAVEAEPQKGTDAAAVALKAQHDAELANSIAIANQDANHQQKQDGFDKKAQSDFASLDKATVNGQIFIATQGGDNIKLALIHVHLFSEDQIDEAMIAIEDKANVEMDKLKPTIDAQKADFTKVVSEYDASRDSGNSNFSDMITKRNAIRDQYEATWRSYFHYLSQAYYITGLPTPLTEAETDADGKFSIQIPKTGSWVLEAAGERSVGNKTEGYLWIIRVSKDAITHNQIFLNNDNLSDHPSDDSITSTMDQSAIDSAIYGRVSSVEDK
jgi:hypothetical protein